MIAAITTLLGFLMRLRKAMVFAFLVLTALGFEDLFMQSLDHSCVYFTIPVASKLNSVSACQQEQ